MLKQQGLSLQEWIAQGRASGAINDTLTVIWLYCMDEHEALRWISAIVGGSLEEQVALMRIRGSQHSHDMLPKSSWLALPQPEPRALLM